MDVQPQYPNMLDTVKPSVPVQNVWRHWISETPETENRIYHMYDLTSGNYDPSKVIKNEE